jgi:hypothetical protein
MESCKITNYWPEHVQSYGKAVLNLLSRIDNNVIQVNSYIVNKITCTLPVTSGASRPELSSAQQNRLTSKLLRHVRYDQEWTNSMRQCNCPKYNFWLG